MAPVWHASPIHRTTEVHAAVRYGCNLHLSRHGSNVAHMEP
jgi:hypothetical protein